MEEQAAAGAWNHLPPQERRQRDSDMRRAIQMCQSFLTMALQHMRLMMDTTAEPACARVLLNSEMVNRAADMLNYFLKFLAGPPSERRKLKVNDPEQYGWDPKELLRLICGIYVHLAEVDGQSAFAKAVAADGRSYNDACFGEAAHVLRSFALFSEGEVARLELFAERVRAFHAAALQEEEDMARRPPARGGHPSTLSSPGFFPCERRVPVPARQRVSERPVFLPSLLTRPRAAAGGDPGGVPGRAADDADGGPGEAAVGAEGGQADDPAAPAERPDEPVHEGAADGGPAGAAAGAEAADRGVQGEQEEGRGRGGGRGHADGHGVKGDAQQQRSAAGGGAALLGGRLPACICRAVGTVCNSRQPRWKGSRGLCDPAAGRSAGHNGRTVRTSHHPTAEMRRNSLVIR